MTNDLLEEQALKSMTDLVSQYRELDALVDSILERRERLETVVENMAVLNTKKQEVEAFEAQTRDIREQYQSSRDHASSRMKQLSVTATDLLSSLIEKVERLESEMKESHRKLTPEIDQSIRASQMKSAYGSSN